MVRRIPRRRPPRLLDAWAAALFRPYYNFVRIHNRTNDGDMFLDQPHHKIKDIWCWCRFLRDPTAAGSAVARDIIVTRVVGRPRSMGFFQNEGGIIAFGMM